jgi:hypothetical protein
MDHSERRRIDAGKLIDLELIRRFLAVAGELNFTRRRLRPRRYRSGRPSHRAAGRSGLIRG